VTLQLLSKGDGGKTTEALCMHTLLYLHTHGGAENDLMELPQLPDVDVDDEVEEALDSLFA